MMVVVGSVDGEAVRDRTGGGDELRLGAGEGMPIRTEHASDHRDETAEMVLDACR